MSLIKALDELVFAPPNKRVELYEAIKALRLSFLMAKDDFPYSKEYTVTRFEMAVDDWVNKWLGSRGSIEKVIEK